MYETLHGVPETPTFVTHLECSYTGERYEADRLHNLSKAGKPLLVRYDLEGVRKAVSKDVLAARPPDALALSRAAARAAHGEHRQPRRGATPLIRSPRLEKQLGASALLVKDEGRLPTGSFKARGLVLAVSMAKELGVTRMAMPTNGNAGAALAAYCSRAGIESYRLLPGRHAGGERARDRAAGRQGLARQRPDRRLRQDRRRRQGAEMGWFDISTLKEPYRIEGKKTMGLELAEQLDWDVPDVILYPTGGGTGLIGMWKAFAELEAIGWLGPKRPRMVAVQATGCAPMVRAYEAGRASMPRRWEMRTPSPWAFACRWRSAIS